LRIINVNPRQILVSNVLPKLLGIQLLLLKFATPMLKLLVMRAVGRQTNFIVLFVGLTGLTI